MYIEEVCIDGFKSYAQRTVVPNFDSKFNAITGLNGTGKSNILDSICFVLGITNLSQVRAANLQELVYKSGQAGVTKATVSIVWNNTDKSKSPVGYELCDSITVSRQIVIGGRNKHLINGRVAQPSQVQNLFHSVQLNVNNPHFLIMQGRITKVLSMKPIEILSMLEEAAGTRMYEVKKEGALKTLEKKQGKLDEIDTVLQNEVRPALENLRKERALYMNWQVGQTDVLKLKRLCVAHSFTIAEKVVTEANDEVDSLKQRLAELSDSTESLQAEIAQKATEIAKLTEEKDKEMGQEVKKLQEQADEASKRLVKNTTNWTNKRELHESEREGLKQLQKTIDETKRNVAEKAAAMREADSEFAQAKALVEKVADELKALDQEQQAVLAGKSSGAEGERTFEQKLSDARAGVQSSGAEAKQAQLKMKHLDKELGSKRKLLAAKQKEATAMNKELEAVSAAVADCQAALDALHFDESRVAELTLKQEQERLTVRDLKRRVDDLLGQLSHLAFSYSDPERGFDRSRVKGLVAKLFTVKDPAAMTALEVAAGGKLYNVIVSDASTGKLVIDKGQLRRRVTIIPLDKIDGKKLPQHVQQAAARVAGTDGARLALSLVGYEDELQTAMAFVFGNSFICRDYQTAEKVCYDKNIRCHTVSLEGEVFNPAGTITGGSRPKTSILQKLQELREAEAELERHQSSLTAVEAELAKLTAGNAEYQRVKAELELKAHSAKLLQERSEKSESHQLSEAVTAMEADLAAATEALEVAQARQVALQSEVSELEQKKADQGKEREARLKALETSIKAAKKEHAAAVKQLKSLEESVQQQAMEREAMHAEIAALQEQAVAATEQAVKLAEQLTELEDKVAARKSEYQAAKDALDATKARIKEADQEISAQAKEQSRLDRKLKDTTVEAKKLDHKVKRMEGDQKESAKLVERLLKAEAWIAAERQLFGKPGTDYDFDAVDIKEAKETYEKKQAEQDSTGKKVNKKVLTMFEHAEGEFKALEEKKNIVEADKAKIKCVIEQLDEKKKEALRVTWLKVNKDFGSIFSTLLPGTTAKLEPPEGGTFLDGLEVKVAFGGVWKQSLTELSGGQRSLLALSLILALLLFKPAPLYILDEVDAALDLSHTQNIGRMIKTHFPQSQFVVVSLKEGMFNNADVIFRTKFVDGVSAVTRTVPAKQREKEREQRPVPVTPHRRQGMAA